MMRRRLLIGLPMLAFPALRAFADDVVRPLESREHLSYAEDAYELALLHAVLERTRPDYGPYEVRPLIETVSNARATQLAIEGRLVNVLRAGVGQPPLEQQMIRVPFPFDKGVLGWRVCFVRRAQPGPALSDQQH